MSQPPLASFGPPQNAHAHIQLVSMMRRIAVALPLWLASILTPLAADTLHIIHTNDFHAHIQANKNDAGAARIAAFASQVRRESGAVLMLDAGDAISGTPVSSIFEGEPIFEVMNLMGYDVGLLGNHEFDHGIEKIGTFLDIATFPLLSANAKNASGGLIADAPYWLGNLGDISVGVIGLTTPDTPSLTTPRGNEGIAVLSINEVLPDLINTLRPKVDVLILLTHLGHDNELELAKAFPSVDLIIGGHSHTLVAHPVKVGTTWVAQADHYGKHVGLITLDVDPNADGRAVRSLSGGLVSADELTALDPEVDALVNHYESQVAERVNQTITHSTRAYSSDELQPILEDMLKVALQADLGFYNRGGIRDSLPEGPISARMIWNIEPFGNSLVRLNIKGSDLLILLSQEQKLHHAADSIDPDQRYDLATNSFIGSHAKLAFGDSVTLQDTGLMIRDVLISHIKDRGLP